MRRSFGTASSNSSKYLFANLRNDIADPGYHAARTRETRHQPRCQQITPSRDNRCHRCGLCCCGHSYGKNSDHDCRLLRGQFFRQAALIGRTVLLAASLRVRDVVVKCFRTRR